MNQHEAVSVQVLNLASINGSQADHATTEDESDEVLVAAGSGDETGDCDDQ
jgi:hypothetical protein